MIEKEKLLTQKDLAERWQVSVRAVENWRKDGIITPVKRIPAIRFTPEHIAELEGVTLERFSPIERRKLENEIEALKQENKKLKEIVLKVLEDVSKGINFIK